MSEPTLSTMQMLRTQLTDMQGVAEYYLIKLHEMCRDYPDDDLLREITGSQEDIHLVLTLQIALVSKYMRYNETGNNEPVFLFRTRNDGK